MRNGLVIMTALPPTRGHQLLINFAADFMRFEGGALEVLLNSRPCEPLAGALRHAALHRHFGPRVMVKHYALDVPQYPEEHPDFWAIWRDLIRTNTINRPGDIVFASESYGHKLAEVLECEFVPCDPGRLMIDVSATRVRQDPIGHFADILPEMQAHFRRTVTFFGAESCGKTTISRAVADRVNGHWVPEWARTYLEEIGPEVTDQKMAMIVSGQRAAQAAVSRMQDKPFIIRDTDLLSTLGYYLIYQGRYPEGLDKIAVDTRADLYIVMNDQIPFAPDPLRYGGDRRESDTAFWTDLLSRFGFEWRQVRSIDPEKQIDEIEDAIRTEFLRHAGMKEFSRVPNPGRAALAGLPEETV